MALIRTQDEDLAYMNQPGLVVNTNKTEYENYVKRRNINRGKDSEINELQSEVTKLRLEIEDIKRLVRNAYA